MTCRAVTLRGVPLSTPTARTSRLRPPCHAGTRYGWSYPEIAKTLGISVGGSWDEKLVVVAKALSPDFRVMIMDEPTATGKSSALSSWQHTHDNASLDPRADERRLTINIREG